MKTIFLAISNPIAASDLLQTNYYDYLSKKYNVVVLGPSFLARPDINYVRWDTEHPRFWAFFKFLRISLVGEFDYLKSIRYWYLRPNYKDHWKRRLVRMAFYPLTKIIKADWVTAVENFFLPRSRKFAELVRRQQPLFLITPTPGFDSLEAELIIQARRARIPTVAVNFTWDNLTMNSKHIRKTNYLIAWNNVMKEEAISIHKYPAERIFVSGTPRFDPYFALIKKEPTREKFLKSKGLNPAHKTIFHTTVTKAYPFQKKYIQDLINLREKKVIPYVNLFIRIHPLDLPENYKEFSGISDLLIEKAGETSERGKVEMSYNDLLNLKYSLKYTDLNINYASTISIEACIFDKPIINIGYLKRFALAYDFNHYKPIVESGAVRVVKTDENLPSFINMYLRNPSLDREGRRRVVNEYVKFTDGLSYLRSVDFLEQCLIQTKST